MQVIIPAAGKGTRLGFAKPKLLYPVADRPILHWLLEAVLQPTVERLIFVVSPEGLDMFDENLGWLIPDFADIVVQEKPLGMGHAVQCGLQAVTSKDVAVVWGDQVCLRRSSVEGCIREHEGNAITLPTVYRPDPYTHFSRNSSGDIISVSQAREGDWLPKVGESDCGFFCFNADILRGLLAANKCIGNKTGEQNLLPVIPMAAAAGLKVKTTTTQFALEETFGINTVEDAQRAAKWLRSAK